jgi:FkbM family methyltransferase
LDLLGNFLRLSPQFKGKRFLLKYWCDNPPSPHIRIAALPNGAKCRIDLRTPYEQMVWLQREEWNDLVALLDLMETGSLLIDIGANIGLWTLVGATKGEVIAVEPNPRTYQMLVENIKLNGVGEKVTAIHAAVASELGEVSFNCQAEHNLSSIDHTNQSDVRVSAITLDSLLTSKFSANGLVIKMDTEGYEMAALLGASKTLLIRNLNLIIEFNTTLLESKVLNDWSVYQHLRNHGFSAFQFPNRGSVQLPSDFSVSGYTNILFARKTELL